MKFPSVFTFTTSRLRGNPVLQFVSHSPEGAILSHLTHAMAP